MRLIYHPDADFELIETARFYEARVPGLGVEFLDAAEKAVCMIAGDPLRARALRKNVRRYLMSRFPYAIFYRVLPDEIRILAFQHHRRRPNYWRYRLSD